MDFNLEKEANAMPLTNYSLRCTIENEYFCIIRCDAYYLKKVYCLFMSSFH